MGQPGGSLVGGWDSCGVMHCDVVALLLAKQETLYIHAAYSKSHDSVHQHQRHACVNVYTWIVHILLCH